MYWKDLHVSDVGKRKEVNSGGDRSKQRRDLMLLPGRRKKRGGFKKKYS